MNKKNIDSFQIQTDKENYKPDILNCLANLSNDEVFTPPDLTNKILDLLPPELFSNPYTKFLDPCCKSGVFLREIAKRLLVGLEKHFPDEQERRNHIFTKQIYGIAITELTALMSRRTLYCSSLANSKYSVCQQFKDEKGNIDFNQIQHTFKKGNCTYCGAAEKEYGNTIREKLESHAYEFIHLDENQIGAMEEMKFDVIIGNPPYQLLTGGSKAQAIPIYQKFVQQSKKLNPNYLIMIIPARWYTGGFGLEKFRNEMINDNRFRFLHDFLDASECFPGVDIKGGVCYFLWEKNYNGLPTIFTHENGTVCSSATRLLKTGQTNSFIRYNEAILILNKVLKFNEKSFSSIISSQRPFGIPTNFINYNSNVGGGVNLQ